tara:strand:- start:145 stop:498 length:354 start_codon:yes stop_codon:yes gene_type:complete
MSTLEVSNLNDGTTTVATTVVTNGSAKAWLDYNQSGPSIDDSYNISSVTDSAAGLFTFTLSNAMASANWSSTVGSASYVMQFSGSLTSTQGPMRTRDATGSNSDSTQNCIAAHGDLA